MKRMWLLTLMLAALLAQPVWAQRSAAAPYKAVSKVTFPAAFTGWTWIGMWDATAGQWVAGRNENSPSDLAFSGIVSDRWYWIGVWDYVAGAWAFGNWHFKSITQTAPDGMVLIPGGTIGGTNPLAPGESHDDYWYPAAYNITVSAFYMDRYPVTKALWDAVYTWAVANGYGFDNAGSGKAANHPVRNVNWYDAVKWCNARSEMEGRPPVYTVNGAVYRTGQENDVVQTSAVGYRLPTDVEWEYAARGGVANRRFPWGDSDEIQHARANYCSDSFYSYDTSPTRGYHPTYDDGTWPYTSPVGSFAPNGYGLYDMVGNIWEWCFDWHPSIVGSYRVNRGGSWDCTAASCRVAYRSRWPPSGTGSNLGFRVVLGPSL